MSVIEEWHLIAFFLFYMVSSGAKSNYFLKAAHHKFLDRFPPCSRKQNYLLCGPVTT